MQWLTFGACGLLAAAMAIPTSAAESDGVKMITSIEGITEYQLENGLKVLLFPDDSKPKVTVNLTVFVGSRHEGYGEAGMAHLLEHMLFKGTPTHPQVPKVLQERGARFNGTTWVDRTNYYETLPASDENLEFALRLEADRMVNSYVKAEDLASEMTVVRNEFERGENSPSLILGQRMMSAAYEWHNYGRSTIGNRADIERVPIDNLKAFYKRYYQPDNAMLVVAGQFDPEKALQYIQKYFGVLPRPERKLSTTYTEEPPQDGERVVTLRRVGDVALAGVVYHIPSGAHEDYASVDVLEGILTSAPSGRLYKSLVETKKASDISGAAFAWHDPGVLRLMAEVAPGNDADVVLGAMLDTIDEVRNDGVTEEEVDRIRRRLLKQRELTAADSGRIAIQLSEWAAQGDWRLYFLYRDRLEKVTAESVNEVARRYLVRNNRTVGVFYPTEKPEKVSIPATPDLATVIGDYKGREMVARGESFDVSPENIQSRTKMHTLPGGVKVAFVPKQTRGQSVNLRLTLRYGDVTSLQNRLKAAEFLPAMMLRGTNSLTRQQLQDELDKAQTRLTASGNAGEATFALQTKRENLPRALDLHRQVLREPTFPQSELEILQQAQISGFEQQLTNPQSLATTYVRRAISPYPPGDPRYVATIEEEIETTKKLTRDDLLELYNDFLGATHGELVVVGDFDEEATLTAAREALERWRPSQTYTRIPYTGNVDTKGKYHEILTPGKANATYFSAEVMPISDQHPDYPALVIGNFILGGGSLSSRLGDRVRQQEGLSYGVAAGFNARSLDDRAVLYIYAITNPANMAKVKTVIREEVDRLLKDGITEEELAAAQKGYLQRETVSRTEDSSLARMIAENIHADRDMGYYERLEENIQNLSTDDVVKALRKHFHPDRLVIVAAGDLENAEAGEAPAKADSGDDQK